MFSAIFTGTIQRQVKFAFGAGLLGRKTKELTVQSTELLGSCGWSLLPDVETVD